MRVMLVLYGVTLGLGALLLFWVQPMFSKMALPLLGGAPAVWNIAMVFFQSALLAGYLYAHLGQKWLRPKWQAFVHLVLLAMAFAALPIALEDNLQPPPGDGAALWFLGLLTRSLGLPFLALAATAPMLQSWFARTGHRDAGNPYFLYGASNLGSIAALAAYPALLEPTLTLGGQSFAWTLGFALLAMLIGACAWHLKAAGLTDGARGNGEVMSDPSDQVDWRRRLHWLALAFVPSTLLLAVTQHITTDLASVPLLWVLPLILYLGTFVIVFARRPMISHRVAVFTQVPLVLILAILFHWQIGSLRLVLSLHLVVFFFIALACHGELAKRRPAPARLTEFYLWMALGGVLGGAFTALCAPFLFDTILEYPIAIAAACLLRPRQDRDPMTPAKALPLALLLALLLLPRMLGLAPDDLALGWLLAYLVPAALLAYGCRRRPLLLAIAVAALLTAGAYDKGGEVIHVERSIYGVNRVVAKAEDKGQVLTLKHGTTRHGVQYVDPSLRRTPLSYYHPDGPLGQVIGAFDDRLDKIAGIGLGIGTAACYQRPGRTWTFFEIDPTVARIARDQRFFHYLADCAPKARVVIGDGRLALAREGGPAFDLLIVDAFSSDSIPMHLLTREAMALYISRLTPDGVIMFNISNRHLDLRSVLADLAADAGAVGYVQDDRGNEKKFHFASTWVVIARRERDLLPLRQIPKWHHWRPLAADAGRRVWTDDYGNLLGVTRTWLRLRGFQVLD